MSKFVRRAGNWSSQARNPALFDPSVLVFGLSVPNRRPDRKKVAEDRILPEPSITT